MTNIIFTVLWCGEDNIVIQIMFIVVFMINLGLAPFGIYKIKKKVKMILDPNVNKSYS